MLWTAISVGRVIPFVKRVIIAFSAAADSLAIKLPQWWLGTNDKPESGNSGR